jgi:hypothetical protein
MHITLKDQRRYALDLAGAQYGQYRAVVPWNEWYSSYCEPVTPMFKPFGTGAQVLKNIVAGISSLGPNSDTRVTDLQSHVSEMLHLTLRDWETMHCTTLAATLDKKQSVYEADINSLLKVLMIRLQRCMKWWTSSQRPTPEQVRSWTALEMMDAAQTYDIEARRGA